MLRLSLLLPNTRSCLVPLLRQPTERGIRTDEARASPIHLFSETTVPICEVVMIDACTRPRPDSFPADQLACAFGGVLPS